MNISGNGKGYAYDLGADRPFFVLFGWGMLVVWLAAFLPGALWLTRKVKKCNKKLAWLPSAVFLLCFGVGVLIIGPGQFAGCLGF